METGISCFRMWSFRPRGGQQMELRKIPDPVVVHAVGGCHINGYPYGPKQSFLNQAFEQVERADVDVRRLAPASFRKINAYFRDPEVPIEGSIVVLQMGNHEAMQRSWRERGGSGGEPWQGDAAASDAPRHPVAGDRQCHGKPGQAGDLSLPGTYGREVLRCGRF